MLEDGVSKEISTEMLKLCKKLKLDSDEQSPRRGCDVQWVNYQPLSAELGSKKLVAQQFIRQEEHQMSQVIDEQLLHYKEFIEDPYSFISKENVDDLKRSFAAEEKTLTSLTDVCILQLALNNLQTQDTSRPSDSHPAQPGGGEG